MATSNSTVWLGPGELEFRDAFARDRLAIAAAGPSEVVQGPLQRPLRFRRSCGSRAVGQEESSSPGMPGASVAETMPDCPRRSTCGKKGAKATCSWPCARTMAARADRSRGLYRKPKAMASARANASADHQRREATVDSRAPHPGRRA